MTRHIDIPGPDGSLEATIDGSVDGAIAVLCHPHPLYGGSMDDLVLATLAGALGDHGIASLRFNFRGVGSSSGTHSGSGGELDDLRAVLAWVQAEFPDCRLLLGGYSFGASIVSQLMTETHAERVLLIAPPVGNLPTITPNGTTPVEVFVGSDDAFVDQNALSGWTHARIHRFDHTDHFFGGHWDELRSTIAGTL